MKFLRNHLFGCIATLLAGCTLTVTFFTDFDVLDSGLRQILRIEHNELDEVVISFVLVIIGLFIDARRAQLAAGRKVEIDAHRLRVLKATMRTVHDLVNNFLSNLQLFRMEAEIGPLSPESAKLFDDLIFETAEKLKALGDSGSVVEYEMTTGVGILPSGMTEQRESGDERETRVASSHHDFVLHQP